MTSRARHWARLGIVVLGICCIASGIYLFRNFIDMFTRARGKEMALTPTSRSFEGWKVSPLPLNFDVYLFNWTNPQDFYVGSGKKPRFEQLGPYRFREQPDKVDIEWHNQNASVSFHKKSWFYFDAAGSNGSLSDIVTTVNTVAHAAGKRAAENWLAKVGVNIANNAYDQEVTVTKTVDEMLFKGYEHQFIKVGKFFRPQDVPYTRVGFQYPRNGSSSFDGDINMFTGVDDIAKMGQIHTWNNLTHTGAFEGSCGKVHGSMGEFFPPNLSTEDSVYMYMPKMCRAIPLDYTETVTVHGVTAYKFSGTAHAVDNGTLHPETSCYCVGGKCMPIGVINIGPCAFNASVYMSFPHFYMADPSYLEAIEGLRPEREKHEFFMTLEPNAGVPMDVGGGFQANYYMEPIPGSNLYSNVPTVMIPMMWCEERVRVSEEIAADIALVPLIVLVGQIITGILLAGGLICTCWYPTRQVTHFCQSDPKAKAKASAFNPLAAFGVNSTEATAPVCQLFRNTTSSPGNDRVGVRLLDYNRDSGLREESGITESSARERLIGEDTPDVLVR
ncbi:protein peste [Drosophila takahashii]|uniref:protein peste n=1 Tax=Drosophila takahashii TaxID=29030 RepID=UPI001CF8C752|nr:protein peste [Drosophila takahashii]